jgi:hypothetical protein
MSSPASLNDSPNDQLPDQKTTTINIETLTVYEIDQKLEAIKNALSNSNFTSKGVKESAEYKKIDRKKSLIEAGKVLQKVIERRLPDVLYADYLPRPGRTLAKSLQVFTESSRASKTGGLE